MKLVCIPGIKPAAADWLPVVLAASGCPLPPARCCWHLSCSPSPHTQHPYESYPSSLPCSLQRCWLGPVPGPVSACMLASTLMLCCCVLLRYTLRPNTHMQTGCASHHSPQATLVEWGALAGSQAGLILCPCTSPCIFPVHWRCSCRMLPIVMHRCTGGKHSCNTNRLLCRVAPTIGVNLQTALQRQCMQTSMSWHCSCVIMYATAKRETHAAVPGAGHQAAS